MTQLLAQLTLKSAEVATTPGNLSDLKSAVKRPADKQESERTQLVSISFSL